MRSPPHNQYNEPYHDIVLNNCNGEGSTEDDNQKLLKENVDLWKEKGRSTQ